MEIIFQVFCAVFSGILSALAIPNELFKLGSTFFAFTALVPLYMAAKRARSYRNAALLFALDAFVAHILSSYWLANFKDFAIFTLGASAVGTACIEAMAGCLYFFPFAEYGKRRPLHYSFPLKIAGKEIPFEPFRILHFALVRAVYEWAKSTGFLAYPWGVLSMAAAGNKILCQSADLFGVYGISFVAAFFAGTLAEGLLLLPKMRANSGARQKNSLACNARCLFFMLLCFFCYGTFRLLQKTPVQKTLNAVLVQQNMDPWLSDDDADSMQASMELSERGIEEFRQNGKKAGLVVWSEAVLRYSFPHSLVRYSFSPQEEPLFDFIKRMDTPFIIGGPYVMDAQRRQFANAALVFDRTGAFKGYYGKSHLVPFAEVIPGVEFPWVRRCMDRLVGFSNGWTSGGTYTLFDFEASESGQKPAVKIVSVEEPEQKKPLVRVAAPICFEDAFPDVCGPFHRAGAEAFVNITDDSWSKTNSAEWQHFAVSIFRSIEYRTSLVRSTNAGVTALVDNKGRILKSAPLFERAFLCVEIPVYQRQETVYSAFGNWFSHLLLALCALLAAIKALEMRPLSLKELVRREVEAALCSL